MHVTILCGLPGSGKTTWIKNNSFGDCAIVSADHFHETEIGKYDYVQDRAVDAHAYCLRMYIERLHTWNSLRGIAVPKANLIVDNTNLTVAEIAPYMAVARAFQPRYPSVLILDTDPEKAWNRKVHDVPREIFDRMVVRLKNLKETWPSFWPEPTVITAG